MQLFGRSLLVTMLDDVPAAFRCAPGVLVVSKQELKALQSSEPNTLAHLRSIVWRYDRTRLMDILRGAAK